MVGTDGHPDRRYQEIVGACRDLLHALTVAVPASYLTTVGFANITTVNAAPFGGTSNTLLFQVGYPTTTTLKSSANPVILGQSVTLHAGVVTQTNNSVPSGQVVFMDGSTQIGSATLTNGSASITVSLGAGSHNLTAVYSGDAKHLPSTSAPLTEVVNPFKTTTTLASSLNPSTVGASVTFTATIAPVAPGSGAVNDGTVTFTQGANTLGSGSVTNGTATFTTDALPAGSYKIIASYSGGTNGKASTSSPITQVVNKSAPTISLSSSANPAEWGQQITFTAQVSPPSGNIDPTGKVVFKRGSTTMATVPLTSGTAQFTTTLPVGDYTITASYNGDTNYTSVTSSGLSQSVVATDTTTGLNSSPNPSNVGDQVTLTATVTAVAPGSGTINSGTVTFRQGSKTLGTASVKNGQAVLLYDAFTAGNHSVTATFNGTGTANSSVSGTLVQVVN